MKTILIATLLLIGARANASGCDWDTSYLNTETLFEFETAATLKCEEYWACEITLDNYSDNTMSVKVIANDAEGSRSRRDERIPSLKVQVVKTTEHGSCYNDGTIHSFVVDYDGYKFTNDFAVKYP